MLFRKRVDDSKQKGVAKELEALGVEVDFMGGPLTKMLKNDWKVLTF